MLLSPINDNNKKRIISGQIQKTVREGENRNNEETAPITTWKNSVDDVDNDDNNNKRSNNRSLPQENKSEPSVLQYGILCIFSARSFEAGLKGRKQNGKQQKRVMREGRKPPPAGN